MTTLDPGTRRMIARLAKQVARHDKQIKAVSRSPQLPASSIDGNGGIDIYDDDHNYLTTVGLRPDGTYGVGYNITTTDVRPGGIDTPALAANSITADKLEALLALVSKIVAGDPDGAHAAMEPDGFHVYAATGDGTLYESTTLGTAGGNSLEIIPNPGTPPAAAISSAGDITGNSLTSTNDLTVAGLPLLGQLLNPSGPVGLVDFISWGCIARPSFRDLVNGITIAANDPVTPIGYFVVTLQPNRTYEIVMHWRGYYDATATRANTTLRFYMSRATSPNVPAPTPTVDDKPMGQQSETWAQGATGIDDQIIVNFQTDDHGGQGPLQYKFLLGLWAQYASFTPDIVNVDTQDNWVATIKDTGRVPWPAPVTPPGQETQHTYTSTWVATDSASWDESGNVNNYFGQRRMLQGLENGTVWHSAFVCNGTAIDGETDKTIPQALATGAILHRVEVWVESAFWSGETGGLMQLQKYPHLSADPSTLSDTTASGAMLDVPFNARSTSMWTDVDPSWIDTYTTGIMIGPPTTVSDETHGHLFGAGADHTISEPVWAHRPKFRLTYTR